MASRFVITGEFGNGVPVLDVVLLVDPDDIVLELRGGRQRHALVAPHPVLIGELLDDRSAVAARDLLEHLSGVDSRYWLRQARAALPCKHLRGAEPGGRVQPQRARLRVVQLQRLMHELRNRDLGDRAACARDELLIELHRAQLIFVLEQRLEMSRDGRTEIRVGWIGGLPFAICDESKLRLHHA